MKGFNQIITIWKKELRDTIRDRRTLMSSIVLPLVLMPLLIIGIGKFTVYQIQKSQEQVVKIAFVNESIAPELADAIQKQDKTEVVKIEGDLSEAVKNDKIDAGIIIPTDFQTSLDKQTPIQIKVIRNSTSSKSTTALSRITAGLVVYNNEVLQSRFSKQKINPTVLASVTAVPEDVATEKERGGFGLGFILPLFIVMWSIIGGQYTAIDASAGEKERKTLEALILTPVRRLNIVFGKFLAVSTVALLSVVISLVSLYIGLKFSGSSIYNQASQTAAAGTNSESLNIVFSLEPKAIIILLAASLFLVFMFSAILLSISIFAKSYKEAQSYIGPAYLIVILPTVFVNTLPGLKPALWFFALPVMNAILLYKEVLMGTYDWNHILVTVGSLVVYSLVAIFLAAKIYSKEGILFRD